MTKYPQHLLAAAAEQQTGCHTSAVFGRYGMNLVEIALNYV